MTHPDPRLVLLLRASAKWLLVEAGLEDLDGAFADIARAVRRISPRLRECRRAAHPHPAARRPNNETQRSVSQ
jgi:hypothetical protein